MQDTHPLNKENTMSDKTTSPVAAVPTTSSNDNESTKPSFWQRRVVAPIKKHPKIAIAVAGGAALIGGSALLGRKSAQYDVVVVPLETVPAETEESVVEDTVTA